MRGKKLWIVVVVFVLFVALVLSGTTAVLAYTSPHEGTFGNTTDACAGCHRAHTATASKLLKSTTQYDLCTSCHDGSGANTKVTTGVYLSSVNGTLNAGLRGGGFEQALMNTSVSASWNATGTPVNITSRHTVGATTATVWGSGTSSNGQTNVTLECGSCHDPHGNSNYRNLRPQPTMTGFSETLSNVNVVGSGNYTVTYDVNDRRDMSMYVTNIEDYMGNWCSQCHTRYRAGAGSETSSDAGGSGSDNWTAGTSPFLYRHRTEPLTGECLVCHVAHGSSASMSGANSGNVTWPDGTSSASWQTGTEGEYSRLLQIDNRGVCMRGCHTSGP